MVDVVPKEAFHEQKFIIVGNIRHIKQAIRVCIGLLPIYAFVRLDSSSHNQTEEAHLPNAYFDLCHLSP